MSTHSAIAVKNTDTGKYEAVYCHFDGYIEGVGMELFENYNSYEKAKELISKGSIRSMVRNLRYYDEPDSIYFYDKKTEIENHFAVNFIYVFKNNEWLVMKTFSETKKFRKLEKLLSE